MQALNKTYPKNCLLTVMDRYSATVRNMEQVVMIPSLLRDVALEDSGCEAPTEEAGSHDLYSYYSMLKSIRVDVDNGLLPKDKWKSKITNSDEEDEEDDEEEEEEEKREEELDLEAQFHLHFSSLHHILTHLTLKANEVTKKYLEITGLTM
ncbi:thyroid hormone-inducible hepatic protein [Dromiciops gliroides]|uniref:thyroid hormone-inducible hepatic protein n=1 Tax=Dromiciops gliroides TaxID=33562 RepID=UPI001CC5818A|nr:thyroid hormone-inducible hepatic protein [Dromiciops gliroides]